MSNGVPRGKFTLLASAARTTHPTNTVKTNSNSIGMRAIFDVTAFTGTSITFTLYLVDPIDSTKTLSMGATAAVTTAGVHTITIDPRVVTTAAASGRTLVGDVAPGKWILVSTGTITSATYTVVVEYFN